MTVENAFKSPTGQDVIRERPNENAFEESKCDIRDQKFSQSQIDLSSFQRFRLPKMLWLEKRLKWDREDKIKEMKSPIAWLWSKFLMRPASSFQSISLLTLWNCVQSSLSIWSSFVSGQGNFSFCLNQVSCQTLMKAVNFKSPKKRNNPRDLERPGRWLKLLKTKWASRITYSSSFKISKPFVLACVRSATLKFRF